MSVKDVLRALWVKACEHDGIDPKSEFVVFSDDNKHAKRYNVFASRVLQARNAAIAAMN